MLDFLWSTGADSELTVTSALITIFVAFLLGLLISFTYIKTYKKGNHSQSFVLTIIMVPAIIAIIILLVGSNVARAFSLAGAFSIIRFRSAPGDPKDITYIFFAMAAGLACGVGLIGYAALFAVVLCLFMFLLSAVNFGKVKKVRKLLKITIPEDLNYKGAFDDVFEKYFEAVRKFIREKYPVYHPVAEADELYELMLHDKKNEQAGVNFTLIHKPGEFDIDNYCSRDEIFEALKQI